MVVVIVAAAAAIYLGRRRKIKDSRVYRRFVSRQQ